MSTLELLAKRNQDESYSVSIKAFDLVQYGFVDFYNDSTGAGYQRNEPQRNRRGREIAQYIERCVQEKLPPRLFELTANVRDKGLTNFDPLDELNHPDLGFLTVSDPHAKSLSIIDGGTRLLGIENALAQSIIDRDVTFDVRLFVGLSTAEEVAQFLLINEKQKRVRTDLSLRVVQKMLDDGDLADEETRILQTVVPETESWRYEASRIAGMMNSHPRSPWKGLIQMPGDKVTRPVKLQAFFHSLKTILNEPDLDRYFEKIREQERAKTKAEVISTILRNFWNAVKSVNLQAFEEPQTNVLWGSIGVNACHMALAPILLSSLRSSQADLSEARFVRILDGTTVADFDQWFTQKGTRDADSYPRNKGELPKMTGAANYVRLAKILENEWRSSIHSDLHTGRITL